MSHRRDAARWRRDCGTARETTGAVLLDVKDLRVAYKDKAGNEVEIVAGVTFQLRRGEALGLAGESGCGKTTTASRSSGCCRRTCAGRGHDRDQLERGIMHVQRRTERGLRDLRWKTVSIVFQGAMNSLDPVQRVRDQIGERDQAARPGPIAAAVRCSVSGAVRLGRHQPGACGVPARVLRRHAPARDDRPRAGVQPRADDRRRADDRPRRDDAGADAGAAGVASPRLRALDDPDHARPRRCSPRPATRWPSCTAARSSRPALP